MVFRTTGYFLERMGLRSLDELPALAPHLPEVAELEAELSQLARPEPVPDPPPEAVTRSRDRSRSQMSDDSEQGVRLQKVLAARRGRVAASAGGS